MPIRIPKSYLFLFLFVLFASNETHADPKKKKRKKCLDTTAEMLNLTGEKMGKTGRTIYGLWDCPKCDEKEISAKPISKSSPAQCPKCKTKIDFSSGDPTYLPAPSNSRGRVVDIKVKEKFDEEVSAPVIKTDSELLRTKNTDQPVSPGRKRLAQRLNNTVLASAAGAAGMGLLGWTIFGTSEYSAIVGEMSWTHKVHVSDFTLVTKTGWLKDLTPRDPFMPVNGQGEVAGVFNIRNSRRAFYKMESYISHYEDRLVIETESYISDYTYSYSNNGDGTYSESREPVYSTRQVERLVTEPVYAEREIYETQVDFDTYVWVHSQTYEKSGINPGPNEAPLEWPSPTLGSLQKADRNSTYKIRFDIIDDADEKVKSKDFLPTTESQFRSYEPGGGATLHINFFGFLLEAEPKIGLPTTKGSF